MDPLRKDLPRILEGLHTIIVGTRDENLIPACTLAAALAADEEGRVTVYVSEASGQAIAANVRANGAVAVVAEYIATHRTVQVKGTCVEIRAAREDERAFIEGNQERFFEDVALIGAPAHVRRRRRWPCHAITFQAAEIFEQTPGPRAGLPFEPSPS